MLEVRYEVRDDKVFTCISGARSVREVGGLAQEGEEIRARGVSGRGAGEVSD